MIDDFRSPVAGWQPRSQTLTLSALGDAGLDAVQTRKATKALVAAGLLVDAGYYVPTSEDLFEDYHTLGAAYLQGRIKVRWVMCAETHDALVKRYSRTNYAVPPDFTAFAALTAPPSPDVLELTVRTVMERNRRWDDPGTLLGIPIRIDPVARRPVFEIISEGEHVDG